ncbi:MAG: hypothetical protein LC663_02445, partial [Actinobacteria bacterium]|nr:hypothetical protein [Actinomycetota bacterium]
LNCGFGTGSYGGVGVLISGTGNDSYFGRTISDTKKAEVMDNGFGGPAVAYGVFADAGGADIYNMIAQGKTGAMVTGRGLWDPNNHSSDIDSSYAGVNTWGTFVDAGSGADTYTATETTGLTSHPVAIGGNNTQWTFGVDH